MCAIIAVLLADGIGIRNLLAQNVSVFLSERMSEIVLRALIVRPVYSEFFQVYSDLRPV